MSRDIDDTALNGLHAAGLSQRLKLEPWYLAYALLGAAVGGIFPIIVPLLALERFGGVYQVGLVMGAFNLGWLLAPVWGYVADRHSFHRQLLIFSLLSISAILAALCYAVSFPAWLGLGLAGGIGVAGAVTLGTLFIIENNPQQEWSERIGRLQMFNGVGQVIGMLLAALLTDLSLDGGLLVAAGIAFLAVLPGRLTPMILMDERLQHRLPCSVKIPHRWDRQGYRSRLKRPSIAITKSILGKLNGNFVWFMLLWFLCQTGSTVVCILYPIIMLDQFGIGQRPLSLGFACTMGVSVFLYAQAGSCGRRFGPSQIMKAILWIRWAAIVGLFLLLSTGIGKSGRLTYIDFFIIFCCGPFIGVSGTTLAAQLSNFSKGEGLGVFNAVFALAAVAGAAMGGWLAAWGGYAAAVGMIIITEGVSLVILDRIHLIQWT